MSVVDQESPRAPARQWRRPGKDLEFIHVECLKRRSETLNSAPPAFLQQLRATCRRFQPDRAGILDVSAPLTKPAASNPATTFVIVGGLTCSTLGFLSAAWDRQTREPREPTAVPAPPQCALLLPDTSQQVDGGRVQGIGDRYSLIRACARRHLGSITYLA